MAPVLQCPDCGTKHPIAEVPARGAFPCKGCGRVLKVPEVVAQRAAPAAKPVPAPVPAPAAAGPVSAAEPIAPQPLKTQALPVVEHNPVMPVPAPLPDGESLGAGAHGGVTALGRVPWWMRLLVWFVAVPVSFLVVFLFAIAIGIFTSGQLTDLFLATGTSRFWPVIRLLPFVALLTAAIVHVGVYALARLRGSRSH